MKMEQTEYFETSAYKIQTPGNYPEENIQHSEHGESLKSIIFVNCCHLLYFVWAPRMEHFYNGIAFPLHCASKLRHENLFETTVAICG
jgi:hypothetical protein